MKKAMPLPAGLEVCGNCDHWRHSIQTIKRGWCGLQKWRWLVSPRGAWPVEWEYNPLYRRGRMDWAGDCRSLALK